MSMTYEISINGFFRLKIISMKSLTADGLLIENLFSQAVLEIAGWES